MSLTAEDVYRTQFDSAAIGRRGYAKQQVDGFMQRVAKTLADEDDLTAAEVHHVAFSKPLIGKRGYDERQVDTFLDSVEDELVNRTGTDQRAHQVPAARTQTEATAESATSNNPEPTDHMQDQ